MTMVWWPLAPEEERSSCGGKSCAFARAFSSLTRTKRASFAHCFAPPPSHSAFDDGRCLWTSEHNSQIISIDLDSTYCVTGSADGLVICWSITDGNTLWQGVTFGRVNEVEICEGRETVLSCGDGKVVQMWDMSSGSIVWENKNAKSEVETVEFDGKAVVFSTLFGNVFYVAYDTGKLIWEHETDDKITDLIIQPSTAALGFDSGAVMVYDFKAEVLLFTNLRHKREVSSLCVTESSTVISASNDFTVRCTNGKGVELWIQKGEVQPSALITIGQAVVVGYKDGQTACFDIQEGKSRWDALIMSNSTLSTPLPSTSLSTFGNGANQEVTSFHYDEFSNAVLVSQMDLRKGDGTLLSLSLANGKQLWRMKVASEICGIATPEHSSFENIGLVVTRYGGIVAFEKEKGRILGKGLYGKNFPEIVSFTVLEDLIMVCTKNYAHLVEFNPTLLGRTGQRKEGNGVEQKQAPIPFRKAWRSPRIGKEGATIIKCVSHGTFGYFVTSNEIFIVRTNHWRHPYIWSIFPTFHEDSIRDIVCLGKYIYTSSTKVIRHKMKYAEKFDGLAVGREILDVEGQNDSMEEDSASVRGGISKPDLEGVVMNKDREEEGAKSEKKGIGGLVAKVAEKIYYYEYRVLQGLQVAIFLQRSAFAFKNIDAPISYDQIADFMDNLVDVMVILPEIPFDATFGMFVFFALFFLFIFTIQESVEFAKFLNPSRTTYQVLWTFMTVYCELCSGFLAIPIMTYLLKIFDCDVSPTGESVLAATLPQNDDDDDGGDDDESNPFLNSTEIFDFSSLFGNVETFECHTTKHYVLEAVGIVCLFFYVPMAIRFLRVDKSLDCIEAKRNFFDWKSDIIALEQRVHAQSLVDTRAERASFTVGVVLTSVSTFVDSDFTKVLIDFLIQAAFVITIHIHPPHFDAQTNKMALLLGYSTLYIFGVAILATGVDDRYNLVSNILPFLLPVILICGTCFWVYPSELWAWYMIVCRKVNLREKTIWRSQTTLERKFAARSSAKVHISGADKPKSAVGRFLARSRRVIQGTKDEIVKIEKKTVENAARMTIGKKKYNIQEEEDDKSTSSSDEDDVVKATFGMARRKRGGSTSGGASNVEKKTNNHLQRAAYQLNFLTLLCSMGLLAASGFGFFYGALYDNEVGNYSSQGQVSPFVSIYGIITTACGAIVQDEVRMFLPTFLLFFAACTALQHDFNVLGILQGAVECVSLPAQFVNEGNALFIEYGESGKFQVPATQEETVFSEACPFLADDGIAYSCGCCGDSKDSFSSGVTVVLRGATAAFDTIEDQRIGECICFKANNLVCGDVWNIGQNTAFESFFYTVTLISCGINACIVVLSIAILLSSTVRMLAVGEEYLNKETVKAWQRFKDRKVMELQNLIAKSKNRLHVKNNPNLHQMTSGAMSVREKSKLLKKSTKRKKENKTNRS